MTDDDINELTQFFAGLNKLRNAFSGAEYASTLHTVGEEQELTHVGDQRVRVQVQRITTTALRPLVHLDVYEPPIGDCWYPILLTPDEATKLAEALLEAVACVKAAPVTDIP